MKHLKSSFILLLFITIAAPGVPTPGELKTFQSDDSIRLTQDAASNFARLALGCIQREYPNKPDHVLNNEAEARSPRSFHPAFYGCFDWHSSVHGHWMLVRLLKTFPQLPEAVEIRRALNANLTEGNIAIEVQYLRQPNRRSFERTYGWAWLLKLAQELHEWIEPDAKRWSSNLEPLASAIVAQYLDFFPKQTYPIRTGVHPNTAFGIAFGLDYARSVHNHLLDSLLLERSLSYYGNDHDCPVSWEPGGEDFFSPCLIEADLMRRVLPKEGFTMWLHAFLPKLSGTETTMAFAPAIVSDRTDPKLVHLDGLNLSRAWCMLGIASALPQGDPLAGTLIVSATHHANSSLKFIASGNYEGEHWLASFAVYFLTSRGFPQAH